MKRFLIYRVGGSSSVPTAKTWWADIFQTRNISKLLKEATSKLLLRTYKYTQYERTLRVNIYK